jgi:hypothetical protein
MLTIFAIPKAFKGMFENIQLNAITSWLRLDPRPQVILLGDDEGTADVAGRLGVQHVSDVDRNSYGTPLMPSIFQQGQAHATRPIVAYVNSDIILLPDFMTAVKTLTDEYRATAFLGVGRKTVIPITELLDFQAPDWESKLRRRATVEGGRVTYDSDFFVFPKGTYQTIPDFAIGRCYWSSWLMFDARRRRIPMIDMTRAVLSVEPKHDYSHAKSTGGASRLSGVEFRMNKAYFKGCRYYTTVNASRLLTPDGFAPVPLSRHVLSLWVRSLYWVYFFLKGTSYPYSIPLIYVARWLRAIALRISSIQRQGHKRVA